MNKHIRGAQLISPGALTRRLNGWCFFYRGLKLGNVWLPRQLETQHMLIFGSQGSGKTSLMRSLLLQIGVRNEPAVVIDPESEFVQEFYRPDRGDLVLNPLDARAPFWSPWLEIHDDADIRTVVGSLVRRRPHDDKERYWASKGQELMTRMLQQLTTLPSCFSALEASKHPGKETVESALEPLRILPEASQCDGTWSAREWAAAPKSWLFLTSSAHTRNSVLPIQAIWLDLLIQRLLSRPIGSSKVWVIGDEIAVIGYQPNLQVGVTTARKHEVAFILSLQNVAQMRAIYGHDPTQVMVDQPATIVIFRCKNEETGDWAEGFLGRHEVVDGNNDGKYVRNYSHIEPLVIASEFQTLDDFHAYIIAGKYRAPLQGPRCYLVKRQPAFVPREAAASEPESRYEWFDVEPYKRMTRIIWKGRNEACNNEKHIAFPYYGGKGVKLNFPTRESMMRYLGKPPAEIKVPSVERLDPTGHYEPGNIVWIERSEQQRNKRLRVNAE